MSIEIENPETLLEKVDALTNLIEQMLLAHRMRDEQRFNEAHDKAAQIGFEVSEALQEEGGLTQRAADLPTVCPKCGGWLKGGECENCTLP
jgi:hypothetical protein